MSDVAALPPCDHWTTVRVQSKGCAMFLSGNLTADNTLVNPEQKSQWTELLRRTLAKYSNNGRSKEWGSFCHSIEYTTEWQPTASDADLASIVSSLFEVGIWRRDQRRWTRGKNWFGSDALPS